LLTQKCGIWNELRRRPGKRQHRGPAVIDAHDRLADERIPDIGLADSLSRPPTVGISVVTFPIRMESAIRETVVTIVVVAEYAFHRHASLPIVVQRCAILDSLYPRTSTSQIPGLSRKYLFGQSLEIAAPGQATYAAAPCRTETRLNGGKSRAPIQLGKLPISAILCFSA
jgi:hypothetical protein